MLTVKRTALMAVVTLGIAAFLGGTGPATAFGAELVPSEESELLLPQSVVAAAEQEAQAPAIYTVIPDSSPASRASSLAALVESRGGTAPANREEECLAVAVYFESRSEPLEGQLAVAKVLLNRASSGRFPSTVCGVVMQPGQFSFVRGGGFPAIAKGGRDWREAIAIAHIAREGSWKSPIESALFFHAARVSPGWRLTRVAAIGNHIFYR